jgi:hypothetical protein
MEDTNTDTEAHTLLMSLHTTATVESARSWSGPQMQSVDCANASAAGVADMVMVTATAAMRTHQGKFKSNEASSMHDGQDKFPSSIGAKSHLTVLVA